MSNFSHENTNAKAKAIPWVFSKNSQANSGLFGKGLKNVFNTSIFLGNSVLKSVKLRTGSTSDLDLPLSKCGPSPV